MQKARVVRAFGGDVDDQTILGMNPIFLGWLGAIAVLAIWNGLRGKKPPKDGGRSDSLPD